jgi:hypothetical protein
MPHLRAAIAMCESKKPDARGMGGWAQGAVRRRPKTVAGVGEAQGFRPPVARVAPTLGIGDWPPARSCDGWTIERRPLATTDGSVLQAGGVQRASRLWGLRGPDS